MKDDEAPSVTATALLAAAALLGLSLGVETEASAQVPEGSAISSHAKETKALISAPRRVSHQPPPKAHALNPGTSKQWKQSVTQPGTSNQSKWGTPQPGPSSQLKLSTPPAIGAAQHAKTLGGADSGLAVQPQNASSEINPQPLPPLPPPNRR